MFRRDRALRLQTGLLAFTTPSGDKWEIDLIELKLQIESVEALHKNEETTVELLDDLAELFYDLGCPEISQSIARQIWMTAGAQFRAMEVKLKERIAKVIW